MKFFVLFFTFCALFLSCQKETYKPVNNVVINKLPSFPFRVVEHWVDDEIVKKYTYTINNRISTITTFKNDLETERVSYTYSGNKAFRTSTLNNYQYTYFLNANGFADSCEIILPGYVNLKEYFSYSNTFKLIRKKEIGVIVSVPFETDKEYFYEGDKMVREKKIEDGNESIINFEYDLSIQNLINGTEYMESFLPTSNYPISKRIYNEDDEDSFIHNITEDTVFYRNDNYSNGTTVANIFYLKKLN